MFVTVILLTVFTSPIVFSAKSTSDDIGATILMIGSSRQSVWIQVFNDGNESVNYTLLIGFATIYKQKSLPKNITDQGVISINGSVNKTYPIPYRFGIIYVVLFTDDKILAAIGYIFMKHVRFTTSVTG